MFCPNCGKKNTEKAIFCEDCGTKIEDNSPKEFRPKKVQKLTKKNKLIIGIASILILILISCFFIISKNYKPSEIAKDYFEALMNNDTDKLYKYLNVKDSGLTSKKIFKAVTNSTSSKLKNYEITSEQISSDDKKASVVFNYTLNDNLTSHVKTVYLVKDSSKKMLIFDNWNVSDTGSLLLTNYEITSFKNATIKLNGVDLTKYKQKTSSIYYDTYKIPEIFKGTYSAEVSLKNGLSTTQKLEISSYSSSLNKFELDDNNKEKLKKQISNDVNKLYESAVAQKSFSDIKKNFEYTNSNLEKLEKAYNNFVNYIGYSNLKEYSIKSVNISNISVNSDCNLYVTANISYNYTAKKYLSEEEINKESKDTIYLTYDYNNEFKLVNMTGLDTYFSRY